MGRTTISVMILRLLVIIIFIISETNATVASQQFEYTCDATNDRGNYTANSTYHTNLHTVLSNLVSNTEIRYGFYNFSYGQSNHKVNAIGLCRGDIEPDECRSCLNESRANLTQLCPNRKEAIGWYDDEICMLCYSDRAIFGAMKIGPVYYKRNANNATNLVQFNQYVRTLLDGFKGKAASGDSQHKYVVDNVEGSDLKYIYGLAQCTPDLSKSDCENYLAQSIERIPDCCKDRIGVRVVRPSCNLRFESSLFYGPTAYAPPPIAYTQPPPISTTTTNNTSSPGKSNTSTITITVTIPIGIAVIVLSSIIYIRVRKSKKNFETLEDEDEDIKIVESLQFNLETIRDATNDFSDSNKLGQGGYGTIYKGTLSNGQEIAVKRLEKNSNQGYLEFKNEVLLMAKFQHRNLVRLFGFCLEGRERLLIYEFVPNKSLDYFIFDPTKRAQFDWETRYKIIEGIIRGLVYLHENSRLCIIHRDLKPANILLDEEMNPKIGDFGIARLFVTNQTHSDTDRIIGTGGYMAPEYKLNGRLSMKSDVFSFGVLVLEIVSGEKNLPNSHMANLISFAWRNWKEGTPTNIADPTLNNDSQNEIIRCIHIALLCVQENVVNRPTMAAILLMLDSSSVTLPIPLEPAYFVNSGTGNVLPEIQSANRPAQKSNNEASITKLYPR